MLDEIIEIAKGCCGEDISWGKNVSILTDMALSSMEIFEFIFKVEAQFSIRLTDRELSDIVTLGDLAAAVEGKVAAK